MNDPTKAFTDRPLTEQLALIIVLPPLALSIVLGGLTRTYERLVAWGIQHQWLISGPDLILKLPDTTVGLDWTRLGIAAGSLLALAGITWLLILVTVQQRLKALDPATPTRKATTP